MPSSFKPCFYKSLFKGLFTKILPFFCGHFKFGQISWTVFPYLATVLRIKMILNHFVWNYPNVLCHFLTQSSLVQTLAFTKRSVWSPHSTVLFLFWAELLHSKLNWQNELDLLLFCGFYIFSKGMVLISNSSLSSHEFISSYISSMSS